MEDVGADQILRPRLLHEPCLAAVYPGGFVTEDMQAPLHGGDTLFLVEPVRSGDDDRVQAEAFVIHCLK